MAATVSETLLNCCNNYILIDVGANITNKKYSRDVESVVQRAKDAGVQKIIIPGLSLKSSKEALRLSKFHSGTVYATAGIHSFEAKSWEESQLPELRELLSNSECVAIGECGLDYTKDFSTPEEQRSVFEMQLKLSLELRKPLYVREKGARADMIAFLTKYAAAAPPVVMHAFVGDADDVDAYLRFDNLYIALSGYMCKNNSETGIQELLKTGKLPLNRILIESDSPYLYPNTRSSKLSVEVKSHFTERSLMFLQRYCTFQRNEPCSLPVVAEMVAGLIGKSADEVALATTFTALKIFGLS